MKTATVESLILMAYFSTINEPAMTMQEVMTQLEKLGSEKMRQINKKTGAGDNQFGVKMGDIRNLAKKIKKDHALALQLWNTGNVDAQLVAALIMDTQKLTI
ncbi:MAG: DNA alkylation repair protein, partial [Chitinophagaceae bacterium]|nr:DNA alkylation repair protein [Chitinophagaceae bacterium]